MLRYLAGFPSLYYRLRRIHYVFERSNLPRLGRNCIIHPTAMFVGPMDGVELGDNVEIDAYAQIINRTGSRIVIGDDTYVAPFATIKNACKGTVIELGSQCSLQHYSIIYGAGPVRIGNYVRIASHCSFVPVNKKFDDPNVPIARQGGTQFGITLEDDIWVGSGVRVLDNCRIGRGSILAAGAVVNRSFEPYSIVGGIPARLLKKRQTTSLIADENEAGVELARIV